MRILLLLLLGSATACRYRAEIDGPDEDGDGFGELVDCDDADASIGPGEPEIPYNGVDDDCDEGTPDDDLDGDGHPEATDCDDTNAAIRPDATETCNGVDDDCDGTADDAIGGTWYTDADGDGYGTDASGVASCAPGSGLVDLGGDCNDADATIHPDAEEDCAALDRNCDSLPDQGVPLDDPGASQWYADADGDGYGDPLAHVTACAKPDGYVDQAGDCDDDPQTGSGVHEGALETCDGIDQDCDGLLDEESTNLQAFFLDDDGDGFGDPEVAVIACAAPPGYVADDTDCDDLDAATRPGGTEICDGKSNDCDVQIDEGATDRTAFRPDVDGDGFGDADAAAVLACTAPADHVANALDCDDNPTDGEDAFPGGFEVCDDSLDNDCDGIVDNAVDAYPWYRDADGDDWGDAADVAWGCEAPVGYVADPGDCDDTETVPGSINPDGDEVCNGADDDCDGFVDDIAQGNNPATGGTRYWLDPDGDGWSEGIEFRDACSPPPRYVVTAQIGDCDESDPDRNEGQTPVCDGFDNDCDGFLDGDDDHDGFPGGLDCPSLMRPDCDDAVAGIYPGSGGCSGGASCLDILDTWETWGFGGSPVDPLTYTIDGETSGTREVVCDMVDDGDRPGAGWTRVYFQEFTSSADSWQYTENTNLSSSVNARTSTACAGRTVLGGRFDNSDNPPSTNANSLGILYRNVDTVGVPHTHAWLDMTFILVDDWEVEDHAYVYFEDRLVWDDSFVSTAIGGGAEVCDAVFQDDRTDLVVDVAQGILHEDVSTDPDLFVAGMGDGDANNEGFVIDDVGVWVR